LLSLSRVGITPDGVGMTNAGRVKFLLGSGGSRET
jgi:hypothetical protein